MQRSTVSDQKQATTARQKAAPDTALRELTGRAFHTPNNRGRTGAKCLSAHDYHAFRQPFLQRLAPPEGAPRAPPLPLALSRWVGVRGGHAAARGSHLLNRNSGDIGCDKCE